MLEPSNAVLKTFKKVTVLIIALVVVIVLIIALVVVIVAIIITACYNIHIDKERCF